MEKTAIAQMIMATALAAKSRNAPQASDQEPCDRQMPTTDSGGTRLMAMATPGSTPERSLRAVA